MPRIFCSCASLGQNKCVIEMYKLFVSKCSSDYCNPDTFYVQQKSDSQIMKSRFSDMVQERIHSLGRFLTEACIMAELPHRGNHGVLAMTVERL